MAIAGFFDFRNIKIPAPNSIRAVAKDIFGLKHIIYNLKGIDFIVFLYIIFGIAPYQNNLTLLTFWRTKEGKTMSGQWVRWDQDPSKISMLASDPNFTLDLTKLEMGDKLLVTYGSKAEGLANFIIVSPATGYTNKDMAKALTVLPENRTRRTDVLIGGSCTYNPESFLGITSITLGNLTIGRDLIFWIGDTENAVIRFMVSKIQVIRRAKAEA